MVLAHECLDVRLLLFLFGLGLRKFRLHLFEKFLVLAKLLVLLLFAEAFLSGELLATAPELEESFFELGGEVLFFELEEADLLLLVLDNNFALQFLVLLLADILHHLVLLAPDFINQELIFLLLAV